MNKAELINAAAEKAGLSKKDTETAINAAIEVISDCLACFSGSPWPRAARKLIAGALTMPGVLGGR